MAELPILSRQPLGPVLGLVGGHPCACVLISDTLMLSAHSPLESMGCAWLHDDKLQLFKLLTGGLPCCRGGRVLATVTPLGRRLWALGVVTGVCSDAQQERVPDET